MSSIAERYLLLGLRLGEHVDGLVDVCGARTCRPMRTATGWCAVRRPRPRATSAAAHRAARPRRPNGVGRGGASAANQTTTSVNSATALRGPSSRRPRRARPRQRAWQRRGRAPTAGAEGAPAGRRTRRLPVRAPTYAAARRARSCARPRRAAPSAGPRRRDRGDVPGREIGARRTAHAASEPVATAPQRARSACGAAAARPRLRARRRRRVAARAQQREHSAANGDLRADDHREPGRERDRPQRRRGHVRPATRERRRAASPPRRRRRPRPAHRTRGTQLAGRAGRELVGELLRDGLRSPKSSTSPSARWSAASARIRSRVRGGMPTSARCIPSRAR